MAIRTRARNKDEFLDLITQALDDVEDLRAAIEYDEEFMENAALLVEPIAVELGRLRVAVKNGNYQTGEGNWLEFITSLKNSGHQTVPFWSLLKLILETHQRGYLDRA